VYTTGGASGSVSFPIPSNTRPGNSYPLGLFSSNSFVLLPTSGHLTFG
jgi:hypothetical protein